MHKTAPRRLVQTISAYRAVATVLLTTGLLFALANVGAAALLTLLPDPDLQGALTYGLDKLSRVYPHRSPEEIELLLRESWSRSYAYEPFTQFKEGRFVGRFVNVTNDGFREGGRELPWPPAAERRNLLVFGGSTTFGYGLADDETIPARLQESLSAVCTGPVAVYNVARSNYFSSQESVLFQRLLARGISADMAVFIDGLNEFGHAADEPKFTRRLAYMMEETQAQMSRRVLVNLPLARLVKRWLPRPELIQDRQVRPDEAEEVINRWLMNREQIRTLASAADVETLFVWQPVPSYGYDLRHHLFAEEQGGHESASSLGYEIVNRLRRDSSGPLEQDFLWLGDLQRGRKEALYVDKAHYTALFASEIADVLAPVIARQLCPGG